MKTTSIVLRSRFVFAGLCLLAGSRAAARPGTPPEIGATNIIPMIVMENVPLRDAIRNLCRQAGFNYILDPHILGPITTEDRRFVPEPIVNCRWYQLSASEALRRVLKANRLNLVENPATTIARIAPAEQAVLPVPAAQVGTDTNAANKIIPLIVMDQVPLREAIMNLARQLRLNTTLDPIFSTPANQSLHSQEVSIRWESVTPRQALAALLDNYGLALRENHTDRSAEIILIPRK